MFLTGCALICRTPKLEAEVVREALRLNSVERRELPHAELGGGLVERRSPLHGGDHEVFGGVFGGDEFEHFRAVASPLQQRCAQSVGDELGMAFEQDAMPQRSSQHGRWLEPWAQ